MRDVLMPKPPFWRKDVPAACLIKCLSLLSVLFIFFLTKVTVWWPKARNKILWSEERRFHCFNYVYTWSRFIYIFTYLFCLFALVLCYLFVCLIIRLFIYLFGWLLCRFGGLVGFVLFLCFFLQLTPVNSNLRGKSKKVRVIGSLSYWVVASTSENQGIKLCFVYKLYYHSNRVGFGQVYFRKSTNESILHQQDNKTRFMYT